MADRGVSDLLSTASKLLNSSQTHSSHASHGGHGQKPSSSDQQGHTKPSHSQKPSYGEILSSAQVVMNAAKTKLHKPSSPSSSSQEHGSVGQLAGAAGTLIGAVSHYGKLEKTGYGKYAHKAQEYLHSYEIKHGKPGTTATAPSPQATPNHATSATAPPPQAAPYHATSEQHGYGQGNAAYTSASPNYSHPSAPPQGYPTSEQHGYGQGHAAYTSASPNYSHPSAPPQGYPPVGYPPVGYPDAQQSYGYGHQGHSKPVNEPPIGYPPAGYPSK